MEIGVALPTMAVGYSRATTLDWCRGVDEGPFSSISCGERTTFRNQEMLVTNAAAAALTERVRVFVNLVVLPTHAVPVIAKQLATMDVLCDGRLTVGLGVGGREHDYRAAGASMSRRHLRLDEGVAEMRRIWSGSPAFDGADPIGPDCVQPGGPPLLAGAMGPKALARAAVWADGISGFSLTADPAEMATAASATRRAWADLGRESAPKVVTGCFFALGAADPRRVLAEFTFDYLEIFGREFARSTANLMETWDPGRIRRVLDEAEAAGVDEFILVPATTDVSCLEAAAELVASR